jgi:hypothetical protein
MELKGHVMKNGVGQKRHNSAECRFTGMRKSTTNNLNNALVDLSGLY